MSDNHDRRVSAGEPSFAVLFSDAVRYHQAGRLAEAEQLYRQVLAIDACHADSLHLLGVIASQFGHQEPPFDLIRTASRSAARERFRHRHTNQMRTWRDDDADVL